MGVGCSYWSRPEWKSIQGHDNSSVCKGKSHLPIPQPALSVALLPCCLAALAAALLPIHVYHSNIDMRCAPHQRDHREPSYPQPRIYPSPPHLMSLTVAGHSLGVLGLSRAWPWEPSLSSAHFRTMTMTWRTPSLPLTLPSTRRAQPVQIDTNIKRQRPPRAQQGTTHLTSHDEHHSAKSGSRLTGCNHNHRFPPSPVSITLHIPSHQSLNGRSTPNSTGRVGKGKGSGEPKSLVHVLCLACVGFHPSVHLDPCHIHVTS